LIPQPEGAQDDAEALELLPAGARPKSEMLFLQRLLWHSGHSTSTTLDMERTSFSKREPHSSQRYS